MFFCYGNEESDDVIGGFIKTVQHSIKSISRNIGAVFSLQTWHQKRTSRKKQNDTYYVVSMATFLVPVSFCEKPNIPFIIF